ncbi:hypothetical protein LguiB_022256 [Lonicera macranthoides]
MTTKLARSLSISPFRRLLTKSWNSNFQTFSNNAPSNNSNRSTPSLSQHPSAGAAKSGSDSSGEAPRSALWSTQISSSLKWVEFMPVELWNQMITGYVNICDVKSARQMFDGMPERDVVRVGDVENARGLFERMPEKNIVSLKLIPC